MGPSKVAALLRSVADRIDASGRPDRVLVSASLRRVLAAVGGTFSGLTLVRADVAEYEPGTLADAGFATVAGEFEFTSPSGKKIEVSGRSGPDGMSLDVRVDGVEVELPDGEEDFKLGFLDPEGYPEEDLDSSTPIDHVIAEVAAASAAP